MEAKDSRLRVLATEPLHHDLVPNVSRCPIFCHLLEQIIVRIKEEGKTWREIVYIQSVAPRPLDVFDAVVESEGQFLQRGRSGFANVISADGNGVPLREMFAAEFECIDDEFHRRLWREDVRLLGDV